MSFCVYFECVPEQWKGMENLVILQKEDRTMTENKTADMKYNGMPESRVRAGVRALSGSPDGRDAAVWKMSFPLQNDSIFAGTNIQFIECNRSLCRNFLNVFKIF